MRKLLFFFILLCLQHSLHSQDQLLFSSSRNGNSDLFLMNGEGRELVQLTNTPEDEWGAVWIDRDKISFLRQEDSGIQRYAMSISQGEVKPLGHPSTCILDDKNSLFSLEGDQVYVCSGKMFFTDKFGEEAYQLVPEMQGSAAYPEWTHNEQEIVFTHNTSGNNEIYMVHVTSGEVKKLTDHPANDERGSLSPDGRFLAFSSNRGHEKGQNIFIKNLQTGDVQNISKSDGNSLISRWSGDGQSIYIGSDSVGNWEIFRYDLDKQQMIRLTFEDSFDGDPRVRP